MSAVDTLRWHQAGLWLPLDERSFADAALINALSKRVSQAVWDAAVTEALAWWPEGEQTPPLVPTVTEECAS